MKIAILTNIDFSLSQDKFGLYAIICCVGGAFLPILIFLTSDRWEEFLGNLLIVLILIFIEGIGFYFGFSGRNSYQGIFGMIFSVIASFFLLFTFLTSEVKVAKRIQPEPVGAPQTAPPPMIKHPGMNPAEIYQQKVMKRVYRPLPRRRK